MHWVSTVPRSTQWTLRSNRPSDYRHHRSFINHIQLQLGHRRPRRQCARKKIPLNPGDRLLMWKTLRRGSGRIRGIPPGRLACLRPQERWRQGHGQGQLRPRAHRFACLGHAGSGALGASVVRSPLPCRPLDATYSRLGRSRRADGHAESTEDVTGIPSGAGNKPAWAAGRETAPEIETANAWPVDAARKTWNASGTWSGNDGAAAVATGEKAPDAAAVAEEGEGAAAPRFPPQPQWTAGVQRPWQSTAGR